MAIGLDGILDEFDAQGHQVENCDFQSFRQFDLSEIHFVLSCDVKLRHGVASCHHLTSLGKKIAKEGRRLPLKRFPNPNRHREYFESLLVE